MSHFTMARGPAGERSGRRAGWDQISLSKPKGLQHISPEESRLYAPDEYRLQILYVQEVLTHFIK